MKCWYLINTVCDRPPGICEGCPIYVKWQKMRKDAYIKWKIKQMKKEGEQNDG